MFRRLLGIALATMLLPLLPACVQQQTNQAEIALQRYRQDYAPDKPTTLASTVIVTTPALEARDPAGLDATSPGSSARNVSLQLKDHQSWDQVRVVWVDTGSNELRDQDATPFLMTGVRARSAQFDAMGQVLTVALSDVELSGRAQPLDRLTLTLDFRRGSSSSKALVAGIGSALNRPPGIGFVGGD